MNKRIKGIKENPIDIAKSVVKRVFKVGKKEADRKLKICSTCPSKVPDELFGGSMCNECFCNLASLPYSGKGCELNKW